MASGWTDAEKAAMKERAEELRAEKGGKVLCFFQPATKFESRYSTFGFQDVAALDEGAMWPTSFALVSLGDGEEAAIAALVKKAVG